MLKHENAFSISWTYLHFLQTLPDFQTVLRNACKAPPSPLSPRRLAATLPGHQLFEKQHHKMRTPTKTQVKLEDNMFPVGEEPSDLHANFVLVRIYKFYDNHNDKFKHFTTSWHTLPYFKFVALLWFATACYVMIDFYMLVQWNVIMYANVTLPLTLVPNKLNAPFFSTLFQWY